MTALDRVNTEGFPISKDLARTLLATAVWAWYREHADEVVFTKRMLFLSITLRIRDLKFLIVRIAGPEVI